METKTEMLGYWRVYVSSEELEECMSLGYLDTTQCQYQISPTKSEYPHPSFTNGVSWKDYIWTVELKRFVREAASQDQVIARAKVLDVGRCVLREMRHNFSCVYPFLEFYAVPK